MHSIRISPKLTVAAQPTLDEIGALADEGYTLLVNNRPDGEDAAQPGTAAEEDAARQAGLDYLHLPVGGAPLTEADVRTLQKAVAESAGPVLAHCRSGTRTLNLWAIGEVLDGRMQAAELEDYGRRVGLDLRGAKGWLDQHGG